MVGKTWRVWGMEGHRIKESFCNSSHLDFSNDRDGVRIIEVDCADRTGTNEYVVLRIYRNTEDECDREFMGQIGDGIFENQRTGICEVMSVREYFPIRERR